MSKTLHEKHLDARVDVAAYEVNDASRAHSDALDRLRVALNASYASRAFVGGYARTPEEFIRREERAVTEFLKTHALLASALDELERADDDDDDDDDLEPENDADADE